MEAELAREAEELAGAVEAFELQAMLQGPEDRRDACSRSILAPAAPSRRTGPRC